MDKAADLRDYYIADRLCRQVRPIARDYLERSLALDRLGFGESASVDLGKAEDIGALDVSVLSWLSRHHPDRQTRCHSARILLSIDQAGRADVDEAVNCLFANGERVVHHARRRGAFVQGWVASFDRGEPSIDVRIGDGRQMTFPMSYDRVVLGTGGGLRAPFSVPANRSLPVVIRGRVALLSSQPTIIYPEAVALVATESPLDVSIGLSVIVPIFGDPDSLADCLDALSEQATSDVAFIVIDDASPDRRVADIGRRFSLESKAIYRRSLVNGGFAAAVNLGLSLCPWGDVLILNSDVVLPGSALERLRAAARSAPDIGTVSPLSNNSGQSGFPDPHSASPVLDVADRIEVDRAAQHANPNQVVDLLAALGSCLYVTRTALNRVGPLSLCYGRGYYEDVDLVLRVRQAGLRNVAACDVYVSHIGGRSFGSEKRALVARNQVILRRRFPDFEIADAVFDFADPLRPFRAAIEARLRPRLDHAVIVVGRAAGGEALFDERTKVWRDLDRPVLLMRWRGEEVRGEIDLTVAEGPGPRSLRFRLTDDDIERVVAYLKPLVGLAIEVLEPEDLPSGLVRLLNELDRPLAVIIESLASTAALIPEPAAPHQSWRSSAFAARSALSRVMAMDSMAAAWLEPAATSSSSRLSDRRPPNPGREIGKLGVSMPMANAAAELFLLSLARVLRRQRATTVIVFGRAIDEHQLLSPGNVWVTGPLLGDDPGVLATQYGVDALLSPYRTSMFWHVESLGKRLGVPIAYFDWSEGRLAKAPDDLALDYRLEASAACRAISAWCSGQGSIDDLPL